MHLRLPYNFVKRLLDVLGASIGLLVFSPVIFLTAVLVAIFLGRPVFFSQPRPGRKGEIFTLRKFRTMRNVDEYSDLVTDQQRLTEFGKWLRSTSLDELPSLWNVFTGKMSFVGPRPLLVEYLEQYTPEQARRHEVRPGITGLAQVSGRNALSWEERFALDVRYVERQSLALDARILVATARSVLVRDGISAEGHVTMRKFGASDD